MGGTPVRPAKHLRQKRRTLQRYACRRSKAGVTVTTPFETEGSGNIPLRGDKSDRGRR